MKILIAGGGIAGLSLALALEQRGIAADVVEKSASILSAGTGLYLPGNATRAIEQLGLLPAVQEQAAAIPHQRILDSKGRQLSDSRTSDVWAPCGPCLSLAHNALHQILHGALRETQLRTGLSITDIEQAEGGCKVSFTDGTSDVYDLVVGADGINSGVRSLVAPGVVPEYGNQICWRFITQNTTGIDTWTAMLGNNSTLLAIPVNATQAYVYADITLPAHADADSMRRTSLTTLFQGFSSPVFPLLEQAADSALIHTGRIGQVVTDQWAYGRVLLIGDAAHASPPSMAEGAGMAMEDALVLAQVVQAESSVDAALALYTQRRLPRVRWVQQQCAKRDKMRALPGLARNGVLRLFGKKLYRSSYEPLLAPV